jgi:hypothetical protein
MSSEFYKEVEIYNMFCRSCIYCTIIPYDFARRSQDFIPHVLGKTLAKSVSLNSFLDLGHPNIYIVYGEWGYGNCWKKTRLQNY